MEPFLRFVFLSVPALLIGCSEDPPKGTTGTTSGLTELVDADGDGFTSDDDCNDDDSAVNGAAIEICDGIDNNCDGNIDEGVTDPFWPDTDSDGFGDMDAAATDARSTPRAPNAATEPACC